MSETATRLHLLVDANYLCRRAQYSTGSMSFGGLATGVAFGVLRDLRDISDQLGPHRVIIAFDHPGKSLRKAVYPEYKAHRAVSEDPEKQLEEKEFHKQVARLKYDLLPRIGYQNIWEVEGYEADDIIAQYALGIPVNEQGLIYSSDKDYWQCITPHVYCRDPRSGRVMTYRSFRDEYKIFPHQWANAKAFAGCGTDNVEGLPGVGEKTAIAWMLNMLKPTSKKFKTIEDGIAVHNRNLPLVQLPYPGLKLPKALEDEVTHDKIRAVEEELGIRARRVSGSKPEPADNGGFF